MLLLLLLLLLFSSSLCSLGTCKMIIHVDGFFSKAAAVTPLLELSCSHILSSLIQSFLCKDNMVCS